MQMRPAGPTSFAGVPQQVTRFDPSTRLDHHRLEMEVLRFQPVAVGHHHVVSVRRKARVTTADLAVATGKAHPARTRRNHGHTFRHSEVPGPAVVRLMASHVMGLGDREGETAAERNLHFGMRRRDGAVENF